MDNHKNKIFVQHYNQCCTSTIRIHETAIAKFTISQTFKVICYRLLTTIMDIASCYMPYRGKLSHGKVGVSGAKLMLQYSLLNEC